MTPVTLEKDGAIAVITVDSPPVNAISQAIRAGLMDAMEQVDADPDIKAAIVRCAGRTFMAGADIREFGKPEFNLPELPDTIMRIEATTKPLVAAIHGQALGGGFEIAMACHYRVATADARFGMPEVNLGLIPGAGGCAQLPRLIGVPAALDMILSAKPVKADKALKLGAIDRIAEGDLFDAAFAFARELAETDAPVRRLSETDVDAGALEDGYFDTQRQSVAKKQRGFPAPLKAIEALEAAATQSFKEAAAVARQSFLDLRDSAQSAALRHVFFAEREVARIPGLPKDAPLRPLASVGIIGAGAMGGGIAMNYANIGLSVVIIDMSAEGLEKGIARIRSNYEATAKKGRMSTEDVETRMALISGSTDYAALADVDLVIEAVFENMDVKKKVFAGLDAACKPGAILASNTSYLDINEIAAATKRPADVIGLHFFNPANVMKLLEIIRTKDTADDVLATCVDMAKKISKTGVISGVGFGFIGNRMLNAYRTEALNLAMQGAAITDVDRVLYDFGLPMGPFALMDLTGLDINVKMRAEADPALIDGPAFVVVDRLHDLGRLGQKTSAGFYTYAEGSRKPVHDPMVDDLFVEEAQKQGIARRTDITDEEIVERCMLALVNEGARILEDGIALRASDIDVTYIAGYGFPRYRGGPMFWAKQQGLASVVDRLRHYEQVTGKAAWTPAPKLVACASAGRDLDDPA